MRELATIKANSRDNNKLQKYLHPDSELEAEIALPPSVKGPIC
jgi:hypothetical protein